MSFHREYDLSRLRGAEYNPRRIEEDAIQRLQRSLREIGVVKPIIARGETIVAGHQRTTALRAMGVTRGPVYLLPSEANTYDEVRFNQLHNGTDLDTGDEAVVIRTALNPGWNLVDPKLIDCNLRATGAAVRNEIVRLMLRFGPWGSSVAGVDGRVFHAAQYALACCVLRKPLLVYAVPADVEAKARGYLAQQYGVFSYGHLPRNTYIQTFAQINRLRGGVKAFHSPTYDLHLIPWLEKHPASRVLDFGCGHGDYVKALAGKGYAIQGLEFFRRADGKQAIDVRAVNGMVDNLVASLREHGRFDAVMCDYVLNSVDSVQAESDVLNSLAAFCKPGGLLFFSGRAKERIDAQMRYTRKANAPKAGLGNRYIEFLDENNLTALYRKGEWFYQKFHTEEDINKLCLNRSWRILQFAREWETGFQVVARNAARPHDREAIVESLRREFNMPLNRAGRTLGRSDDVLEVIECLL